MQSPRERYPSATVNKSGCTDNLFVAVRLKPFPTPEEDDDQKVVQLSDTQLQAINGVRKRTFNYDCVFSGGQDPVFEKIGVPMVDQAFEGFNVCLFAYGVTGSGKSYSMYGGNTEVTRGLVPRSCTYLFQLAQQQLQEQPGWSMKVTLQFVEIYNEKIRDLLQKGAKKGEELRSLGLGIHKKTQQPFIKGVSRHVVTTTDDVQELVSIGSTRRQTSATNRNQESSRSHSILQLFFRKTNALTDTQIDSVLTFVDLAGSESISVQDPLFAESKNINQSLLALGRVLNYCVDTNNGQGLAAVHKRKQKIPFLRTSKLTRLLGECFGGNSRTFMLATVVPCQASFRDSLFTLSYAQNARMIGNQPKINRHKCTDVIGKHEQVERCCSPPPEEEEETVVDEEDPITERSTSPTPTSPPSAEWIEDMAPAAEQKPIYIENPPNTGGLWSTPHYDTPQPFHVAFPQLTCSVTSLLGWDVHRQTEVDSPAGIAALCAEIMELRHSVATLQEQKDTAKEESSAAWKENIKIQENLQKLNTAHKSLKEKADTLEFKAQALERINHEIVMQSASTVPKQTHKQHVQQQQQHSQQQQQQQHISQQAAVTKQQQQHITQQAAVTQQQQQQQHISQHTTQTATQQQQQAFTRQMLPKKVVTHHTQQLPHQNRTTAGTTPRLPFNDISNQFRQIYM